MLDLDGASMDWDLVCERHRARSAEGHDVPFKRIAAVLGVANEKPAFDPYLRAA